MCIEIKKISILLTQSSDLIYFETTLPNPIWPFTGNSVLKMEAASGNAEKFVKDNFPNINYTIKNIR